MKIFVTGAAGYIGKAVCRRLKTDGHDVIGLTHHQSHVDVLNDLGVKPVLADLKEVAKWKANLSEADAAIHLAQDHQEPAEADRAAVDAIVDSFGGTNKRFIYTSGLWVLGETGPERASEITPTNPIPMVEWRADTEKRLVSAEELKHLNVVIIRPGIVYGEGGGIPAMLSRSAYEEGEARYIGDGQTRWPMVEVNDLAELYALALTEGEAGEIYNGVDDQTYTVRELAEAASQGAGRDGKTKSWPKNKAKEELGAFAEALCLSQNVSGAKAREFLGWEPKAPYNAVEDLKIGSYAQGS